jgi:hypothetical protein
MSVPNDLLQRLVDEVQHALSQVAPQLQLSADVARPLVEKMAEAALQEADNLVRQRILTGAATTIGATLGGAAATAIGASIGGPFGPLLSAPVGASIGGAVGTALGSAFSAVLDDYLQSQMTRLAS